MNKNVRSIATSILNELYGIPYYVSDNFIAVTDKDTNNEYLDNNYFIVYSNLDVSMHNEIITDLTNKNLLVKHYDHKINNRWYNIFVIRKTLQIIKREKDVEEKNLNPSLLDYYTKYSNENISIPISDENFFQYYIDGNTGEIIFFDSVCQ